MPGAKIFPTTRLGFFDGHIWVAIPHDLDLIAFFRENRKLFVFAGRPFLLVITRERLASIDKPSRSGSLNV